MNEIFKRASIRRFEDRAVEEEKITMILKAAMAAPSAGNQQPWEFYVVTDREKIKELSKCSPYSRCAAKAPVVLVPCMKTEGLRLPEMALVDLCGLRAFAMIPVGYPAEERPREERYFEDRIHRI